jgi:hypothetical protein
METTITKTVKGQTMEQLFDRSDLVNIKHYTAADLENENEYNPKTNYMYKILVRHPENTDANVLFEEARFKIENMNLLKPKPKMTKTKYEAKMKKHEQQFDKLWTKIVSDTNKFIQDNPETSMYSLQNTIEKFADQLVLSGAWIPDRINGYSGVPSGNKYSKSLTKKVRKSLGYTF